MDFSLINNPWANPNLGGPRKLDDSGGGFWDTVGDGLSTGINIWLARDAAEQATKLQAAQWQQEKERLIIERNVQPDADPSGYNQWGSPLGPRKIGGLDINQDNLVLMGAIALAVWAFQ